MMPPHQLRNQKKQVGCDMEWDLCDDPTLPQGLTLFLEEDAAEEWDDAPGPNNPVPEDSQQVPPSEGPQHHTTHTGGARP